VYVVGYAANGATIWKNGVATTLAGGTTQNYAEAFSVFATATDVYTAGVAEVPFPNTATAVLWKNNLPTNLATNGTATAAANSVFVSGTDVYVAGSELISGTTVARVWKNAVATTLSNVYSDAKSVFVSGTDVYVVGRQGGTPTIWKNGVATNLSNVNDETRSVFVFGTDVYVAGYQTGGTNDIAKIWKNGLPVNLSDGTAKAVANSVYVK
jgi:hypothetical protein